ncbi:bifunctional metallophosphatase/5'-nucleotidase [candidate division KSB1 bacterium]|nr:bifunctional metallophosphatase/5'-nucleotidase [candidate division KSB1 bacterium]
MKRTAMIMMLMGILVSFSVCSRPQAGKVTILFTNDMHCQYLPMPATWVDGQPKPLIGGMTALEYFISTQRGLYPNSLLLDSGDLLTGTPISRVMVDSAYGGGFVNMMNIIGYDAYTIGNHDFDEGQSNLFKLLDLCDFDILSANLYIKDRPVAKKGYEIYRVNNLRIGVIGLILKDIFDVAAHKNLADVRIDDPVKVSQQIIDQIDGKTDLIVILSHLGIEGDVALAQKIQNADIIIGGHSHTRLQQPQKVNDVLICQAGSKTTNLGRMVVHVAGDCVSDYDYNLIDTWVDSVKDPNPDMVSLVEKYKKEIDAEYNQQVGILKSDWESNRHGESNIGNFIADAMRSETNSDFALINSGSIRKPQHPSGPITRLDIQEILPFSNYVELFQCTGEQLLTLIKENIKGVRSGEHGLLQVSGLHYTYRFYPGNEIELITALINGKNIDTQKVFTGATVDFILQGQAQKYFGFDPGGTESTGILLSDMLENYIFKNPVINTKIDGRIKEVK